MEANLKNELQVKEMPKVCINEIEWEHLQKQYEFYVSSGERIIGDVNENTIENIFNVLQEWDKNDEEFFQEYGMECNRRVANNMFKICVDVDYFKGEDYILTMDYEFYFVNLDNGIKLKYLSGGADMRLSKMVSQDWKRDVFPYQNHTNRLLSEVMEKNKILIDKFYSNEMTWVELIHTLN